LRLGPQVLSRNRPVFGSDGLRDVLHTTDDRDLLIMYVLVNPIGSQARTMVKATPRSRRLRNSSFCSCEHYPEPRIVAHRVLRERWQLILSRHVLPAKSLSGTVIAFRAFARSGWIHASLRERST
jgi:hypothetical protein